MTLKFKNPTIFQTFVANRPSLNTNDSLLILLFIEIPKHVLLMLIRVIASIRFPASPARTPTPTFTVLHPMSAKLASKSRCVKAFIPLMQVLGVVLCSVRDIYCSMQCALTRSVTSSFAFRLLTSWTRFLKVSLKVGDKGADDIVVDREVLFVFDGVVAVVRLAVERSGSRPGRSLLEAVGSESAHKV
jgi:hypothetical protein